MKKTRMFVVINLGLLCCAGAFAQEPKKSGPTDGKPSVKASASSVDKAKTPVPSQDELEAQFKAMLTNATMSGRWSPIENAQLGPEKKEDKYSIVSANKVQDDQWVINAKMGFGGREMVVPVPVKVKWSGDTPVLIVNNFSTGGNKSYSARVLFYDHTYAGTWNSSAGYGGLLYGTITQEANASKPVEPKPESK